MLPAPTIIYSTFFNFIALSLAMVFNRIKREREEKTGISVFSSGECIVNTSRAFRRFFDGFSEMRLCEMK